MEPRVKPWNKEAELREQRLRCPLWQETWAADVEALATAPGAPEWTGRCGDRQTAPDRAWVQTWTAQMGLTTKRTRGALPGSEPGPLREGGAKSPKGSDSTYEADSAKEADSAPGLPPAEVLPPAAPRFENTRAWAAWVEGRARVSPLWARKLAAGGVRLAGGGLPAGSLLGAWPQIPPMERRELAWPALSDLVPGDAPLARLVKNPSSGTTGQVLPCPNHPRAVGALDPVMEHLLALQGLDLAAGGRRPVFNLGWQTRTLTYYTVHSWFEGLGFAKLNAAPDAWDPEAQKTYFRALNPQILASDPYTLKRVADLGLPLQPRLIFSTALELDPADAGAYERLWGCPVIDLYSANETGPLAWRRPAADPRWRGLCPDIKIELVDPASGQPVGPGNEGEVWVSGGRNPYLPLLRYRLGDRAIAAPAGFPGFAALLGRRPVSFRSAEGAQRNPVDLARLLARFGAVRSYSAVQGRQGLTLHLAGDGLAAGEEQALRRDLAQWLGDVPVTLNWDDEARRQASGGKVCAAAVTEDLWT